MAFPQQSAVVFDVECYRNFFLILFKKVSTGEVRRFELSERCNLDMEKLEFLLNHHLLVGFNSRNYDLLMIQMALKGHTTEELKRASDEIIVGGMGPYDFADAHQLQRPTWNHIDLISVAPLKASLKLYAGRLHCRKMQDLPIDPDALISESEAETLVEYCGNDLDNTAVLLQELEGQIKLRVEMSEQYGIDLRSKSDAQVAEKVISAEVMKINQTKPQRPTGLEGKSYKYQVPEYLSYGAPQLKALLEKIRKVDFVVGDNGSILLPPELEKSDIKLRGASYRIGIGGLHSSETSVCHVAGADTLLIDRDVTSYYPAIILNQGLYPKHLGGAFLTVYRTIFEERIAAKKKVKAQIGQLKHRPKDEQLEAELLKWTIETESKKLVLNGSFGKLGNKWSVLYAPDLLIQVTLTGQLALLMLIDMLVAVNIPVISANTDGILLKCPAKRYADAEAIITKWEKLTGFATEETRYKAVFSKDINNYIAIKTDGSVKGKGLYANPWEKPGPNIFKLQKNPSTTIVIEAAIAFLRDGVPLEKTIKECRDITKFIAVRTVNGGATFQGKYLGKAVRWIYSGRGVINYQTSGNKVPKSDGAKPLMELPAEFPNDVNYGWYIEETQSLLCDVGYMQGSFQFEEAA